MRFRASLPKEQREIVPMTMVKEGQAGLSQEEPGQVNADAPTTCLLYTSDAADE